MRDLRRAALLAASGTALAVTALGCSLTPQKPKQIPPAALPPSGANRGKIGDSIRLAGSTSQVRVRVVRVLDPAPVGPSDVTLAPGARFVGVEVSLTNVGQTNYDDSPLSDAKLLTDDGRKANSESVLGGPCGRGFATHVSVPPGGERHGCIPFEVRSGRRPAEFRFALDSGFAPEAGTWKLR